MVSAAMATLIAGVLAILGTLLGVVIERLLRLTGRVTCVASGWQTTYFSIDEYENPRGPEPERPEDVVAAEYRFAIDLFNGKEMPVGLRDPRVVIVPRGGHPIESRPRDIGTGKPSELFGTYYSTLDVLNLPPRQYVHKDLKGSFDQDGASVLASGNWSRIELVAEFPKRPLLGGKTYRETIAEL